MVGGIKHSTNLALFRRLQPDILATAADSKKSFVEETEEF